MCAAQCGLLEAALIQTLADLQHLKSFTRNAAYGPVECGLGVARRVGRSRPSPINVMPERVFRGKRWGKSIMPSIAALLFSLSPAFSIENPRVRHLDTVL